MDDFESSNFPSPERNTDPIPFDDGADLSGPSVSHSPLDLGGGGIIEQIPRLFGFDRQITNASVSAATF